MSALLAAGFAFAQAPLGEFPLGVWYEGGVGAVRHNLIPDDPKQAYHLYLRNFKDIAAHGCNVAVAPNSPPEHHKAILNAAEKAGVKLILELGFEGGPIGAAIRKGGTPDPELLENSFRERLKPIQDHPALLRVQLLDEPWREVMPTYGLVAEAMRAYSPKVPAFCCIIEADNAGYFLEHSKSDVVAFDCYPLGVKTPIGDEKALSKFDSVAIQAASEARKHKANAWAVIQCHSITNGLRFPTVGELRRMTYGAVASGCRGIFWFLYQTEWLDPVKRISMKGLVDANYRARPLWTEVRKLTGKIRKWEPVLTRARPFRQPAYVKELHSSTGLATRFVSEKGEAFLLIQNPDTENTALVTTRFSSFYARRGLRLRDVSLDKELEAATVKGERLLRTKLEAGEAIMVRMEYESHR